MRDCPKAAAMPQISVSNPPIQGVMAEVQASIGFLAGGAYTTTIV